MKKNKLWFAIMLLPTLLWAEDLRPADTQGLWKLTQQTVGEPVTLFVWVPPAGEMVLYNQYWVSLPLADAGVSASRMKFSWQAKGANLVFDGAREGQRVSGEWELIHPQYKMKKSFEGSRVFTAAGDWQPLRSVESKYPSEAFIDFSGFLATEAGKPNFTAEWKQNIYPDFFVFLETAPAPDEAAAILRDSATAIQSEKLAEATGGILNSLRKTFPGVTLPARIVSVPFGPAEPQRVIVNQAHFLVVNPKRLAKEESGVRYENRLAQEFVRGSLEFTLPPMDADGLKVFKVGLPLYVSSRLSSSDKLSDIFFLPEARVAELKAQIPDLKKMLEQKKVLSADAQRLVAFDFAQTLVEKRSLGKVLAMNAPAILVEYQSYLSK